MSVRAAFLLVVLVTLAGAQRAHAADAFEREFGAGAIPGADAPGAPERGSTLAYPLVSGQGAPDLVLAQRTIELRPGAWRAYLDCGHLHHDSSMLPQHGGKSPGLLAGARDEDAQAAER